MGQETGLTVVLDFICLVNPIYSFVTTLTSVSPTYPTALILLFFLKNFMLLDSFYTPQKYQKTRYFLIFPGGIERVQWQKGNFADNPMFHQN